jgi:hypothetical protein
LDAAAAQATLCTMLRTLRQRGHEPFAFLVAVRRTPPRYACRNVGGKQVHEIRVGDCQA